MFFNWIKEAWLEKKMKHIQGETIVQAVSKEN